MPVVIVVRKAIHRKGWLALFAVLLAVGLSVLEVSRPGTIASILSGILAGVIGIWDWLCDAGYALRELVARITGWYR